MLSRIFLLLWCLCGVVGIGEAEAPEGGQVIFGRVQPLSEFYGQLWEEATTKKAVAKTPPKPSYRVAKVSYYGPGFHGRKMANGERFNAYGHSGLPTVAHKTLPFGTLVEFRNPKNGKKILTRVADRGPYVGDRQFDLNVWTAQRLGIIEQGVAKIEYAVVGRQSKAKGAKRS